MAAYDLRGKRVFVAGHRGMVGAAIARRLAGEECRLVTAGSMEVDLRRQEAVERFLERERPQAVFLAAARVGGILANSTRPAEFIYDNLMIEANVIETSRRIGVEKLLFLGSSCIYPRLAPQPMAEGALLTGPLEPTNQPYALAKIAGIELCDAYRRQHGSDFISVMPTNLYGPGDNFDPVGSHVLPALLRRLHEAKLGGAESVTIWGSGAPLREFLHVDDLADACVFLMKTYSEPGLVNIGSGDELSIKALAELIAEVVGYNGRFEFDRSKPDGAPRKLLDLARLHGLGWRHRIPLRRGIEETYRWYRENVAGSSMTAA
jgi:GDP-L-fucose synthase